MLINLKNMKNFEVNILMEGTVATNRQPRPFMEKYF